MTDEIKSGDAPHPDPDVKRARRASDQMERNAIANSTPDDNHILMRMLRLLFRPPEGYGWTALLGVPMGAVVIGIYVVAKWGVPAILAAQTLILQLNESSVQVAAADRSVQAAQAKATQDVVTALGGVTDAVKGLSGEVSAIRTDVTQLKQDRIADQRRLNALQQRIEPAPVRR